jgi:aspartate racemase
MIGVIGGNGVAATNKLCELIETAKVAGGALQDAHHPEMLIWQATLVPSRSMYLEGKGESFIDHYIDIAKKLKNCGATKICMCCNAAHYALDEISGKADISMIDLIDEVVFEVKSRSPRKIALLASAGTIKAELYQKKFSRHAPEIEIIYPDVIIQELVTEGIRNVKNMNRFRPKSDTNNPNNIFNRLYKFFFKLGADIVVMGCTDIGVVYPEQENTVDSLHALSRAILSES